MLEWYRRNKATGEGTDTKFQPIPTDTVKVRNDSCADRREGEVMEIYDHLLDTVDPLHLWFSAAIPSNERCYGILRVEQRRTSV